MDGYFLVSRSGSSPIPYETSEGPSLLPGKMGPQLFYVPFVRSVENRDTCKKSTFLEKLHIGSLYWKWQSLSDKYPVLPIWTVDPYNLSSTAKCSDDSKTVHSGRTPFPTARLLDEMGAQDPTTDLEPTVRGPICDVVEGKIMLASAGEYRSRCNDVEAHGVKAMQIISDGEVTANGQWVRSHELEGDDQVQAFIKKIGEWVEKSPEDMIRYEHARSWAPVALFHATVDPAKSYVAEVDDRALRWARHPAEGSASTD